MTAQKHLGRLANGDTIWQLTRNGRVSFCIEGVGGSKRYTANPHDPQVLPFAPNLPPVFVSEDDEVGARLCNDSCHHAHCTCGFTGRITGQVDREETRSFWMDLQQEGARAAYEAAYDL